MIEPTYGVVVFADTGEQRQVVHGCKTCKADPENPMIVSVHGVAHESDGWGVTRCGVDATGEKWWWRE